MENRNKAIIADIDGTLAIRGDRSPYDWHRVGEDIPNRPIVTIVNAVQHSIAQYAGEDGYVSLIFTTGRKEICRDLTLGWLKLHMANDAPWSLFMRANNDNREDHIVKEEIYREKIEPVFDVIAVFDDRQQVVDMWRRNGLTCLQVAEGNF